MILLIIYIAGMIVMPALCWVFIESIQPGKLNEWYDSYILFPLRTRAPKLEQIMGGCEMCFSIWMGAIYGTIITGYYLFSNWHWPWLIWAIPTALFLNLGMSATLYKLFKQLK